MSILKAKLLDLAEVVGKPATYDDYKNKNPFLVLNFNYSKREPKTAREHEWYKQHAKELLKCLETGKCLCGAEITLENPLLNIGWEYGFECYECK